MGVLPARAHVLGAGSPAACRNVAAAMRRQQKIRLHPPRGVDNEARHIRQRVVMLSARGTLENNPHGCKRLQKGFKRVHLRAGWPAIRSLPRGYLGRWSRRPSYDHGGDEHLMASAPTTGRLGHQRRDRGAPEFVERTRNRGERWPGHRGRIDTVGAHDAHVGRNGTAGRGRGREDAECHHVVETEERGSAGRDEAFAGVPATFERRVEAADLDQPRRLTGAAAVELRDGLAPSPA
jgi:hypothetical protein